MSRPLRLHAPGLMYHVFARGNEKGCIFADDDDCGEFVDLLEDALPRFRIRCVAFCLLWNHYHLLLIPTEHPISRLMQQLNSAYCQGFNRRHARIGHVLQGRFGSRIVEDGAYARTVLRYIALNPVQAGQVARPEEWRWSSYRFATRMEDAPGFLALDEVWRAFGTADAAVGSARFAQFVEAGIEEVFVSSLLHGSAQLAARLAPRLEPHHRTIEFSRRDRFAARPPLSSLLDRRTRRIDVASAAHVAFHRHGYTLAEIGAVFGKHPSTVWRWIQRAALHEQRGRLMSSGEDKNAKIKI